jgi:hypothetical protein
MGIYLMAHKAGDIMERQDEPNFFRAFDRLANNLSQDLGITEKKARSMMVQNYKERHYNDYFSDYDKTEERRIKAKGMSDQTPAQDQKASISTA